MKADTSEGARTRGRRADAVIHGDLGSWDAPWPLERTADEAREPFTGQPRRVRLILSLSLAALLGALLLAARLTGTSLTGTPLPSGPETPLLLGSWLPAADAEGV